MNENDLYKIELNLPSMQHVHSPFVPEMQRSTTSADLPPENRQTQYEAGGINPNAIHVKKYQLYLRKYSNVEEEKKES